MKMMNQNWRCVSFYVWDYLVKNHNHSDIFSCTVAEYIDTNPVCIRYSLLYILEFCERNGLPPLSGLVIKKRYFCQQKHRVPVGYFRIYSREKYYFKGDNEFEILYCGLQKKIERIKWNEIEYNPIDISYSDLRKLFTIQSSYKKIIKI